MISTPGYGPNFTAKRDKLREETYRERLAHGRRKIDRVFDEYRTWIEDTMETEDSPYLQVVAVLVGESLIQSPN